MMNFKRVLLIILTLLLSASFTVPSPAQEKAGSVQVDLTAEERAFLAGKQLRLGVDSARPPFEFIDEKGVYSGISAGFMQACLERLGVSSVLVPGLNVGAAMKKLKEGEIDIIPKISPDLERAKEILFTRVHATFATVIVTRKDMRRINGLDNMDGLKVGVLNGLIVATLMKRDHPRVPLVPLPDVRTALIDLSSGKIDVYLDNLAIVSYNIERLGLNNLKIDTHTPYNYEMAFGVRKDWPLLASALDKALASFSKQERSAITGRWLTVESEPGIDWKAYGKVIVPIVVVLLIVIISVFLRNRSLRSVIRERERIQEELKENAKLLEFSSAAKARLSRISTELQKSATLEEMVRTFMSLVSPLMGAAYGVFYLMDEEKGVLLAVGGYGWTEAEAKSHSFRVGEGLVGQCAREKKPLILNNSESSNLRIAWGGGHFDLCSILLQPILEQDKILGVIELGAPQPFTPEQRLILDEIMPTVALNLLITRRNLTTQELLAKGQEQIAELGKARKATLNILEDLEVSRKETEATAHKMDAMSQAVNDAMVMIDGQGKVMFWNQAAERLFGYTAAEAIGMDFHAMVVSAEDQEKAHAGLRQFSATGEGVVFGATIQTTAINRAGLTFPVEVNLSSFELGEKWFAVGTVRDITERKQAEKNLKDRMEEMERFSRLTIDREKKMIQLKEEINTLLEQTGKEKKYKIVS
ncbi:MAG: PAS domain S-box protein [Syntrophales bacterium]